MTRNKQLIITLVAAIWTLFWRYVFIIGIKNENEYNNLAVLLEVLFGYSLAVITGIIALCKIPYSFEKYELMSICNFSGTFNICFAIASLILIYRNNGNKFSIGMGFLIIPIIFGFIILKNIFFNPKHNKKAPQL